MPRTSGFGDTAFASDAYAGLIVGWGCSRSKKSTVLERTIRHAAALRRRQGHPLTGQTIRHSDAGSQNTVVRCGETLLLDGLRPSIGTVENALDHALAETTIGLSKTECLREDSPFRRGPITTLTALAENTSAWAHWYHTSRLMHRLGQHPPAETEAEYSATTDAINASTHKLRGARNPGRFTLTP